MLWTIYYDPLLQEINDSHGLGYTMSHFWRPDVLSSDQSSLSCTVSSQAYMDDTTWLAESKASLESTLTITDSFYVLNNIQVNKQKSVLMTTENTLDPVTSSTDVTLSFGTESIVIAPTDPKESVRVLGVWINLNLRTTFVYNQAKAIITSANQMMKFKKLTASQMVYIFNTVICPRIMYRTQLTVIPETSGDQLTGLFRRLFKSKIHLVGTCPTAIIHSVHGYGLHSVTIYN